MGEHQLRRHSRVGGRRFSTAKLVIHFAVALEKMDSRLRGNDVKFSRGGTYGRRAIPAFAGMTSWVELQVSSAVVEVQRGDYLRYLPPGRQLAVSMKLRPGWLYHCAVS